MSSVERTKIIFREVPSFSTGRKLCCRCGKKISKRIKVSQTISPFNNRNISEIIAENNKAIETEIKEWEGYQQECSACRKKKEPSIDVEFVTKEDWNATQDLRNEISALKSKASELKAILDKKFVGKCVRVKHRGRERIGKINSIWDTDCFGYDIVRSDLKGITYDSDYNKVERILE